MNAIGSLCGWLSLIQYMSWPWKTFIHSQNIPKIVSKMALNVCQCAIIRFKSTQHNTYRHLWPINWKSVDDINRSSSDRIGYNINIGCVLTINFEWNWNFNEFLLINKQIKFKLDDRYFIRYTMAHTPPLFRKRKKINLNAVAHRHHTLYCMRLRDKTMRKNNIKLWRPKQTKITQSRERTVCVPYAIEFALVCVCVWHGIKDNCATATTWFIVLQYSAIKLVSQKVRFSGIRLLANVWLV